MLFICLTPHYRVLSIANPSTEIVAGPLSPHIINFCHSNSILYTSVWTLSLTPYPSDWSPDWDFSKFNHVYFVLQDWRQRSSSLTCNPSHGNVYHRDSDLTRLLTTVSTSRPWWRCSRGCQYLPAARISCDHHWQFLSQHPNMVIITLPVLAHSIKATDNKMKILLGSPAFISWVPAVANLGSPKLMISFLNKELFGSEIGTLIWPSHPPILILNLSAPHIDILHIFLNSPYLSHFSVKHSNIC